MNDQDWLRTSIPLEDLTEMPIAEAMIRRAEEREESFRANLGPRDDDQPYDYQYDEAPGRLNLSSSSNLLEVLQPLLPGLKLSNIDTVRFEGEEHEAITASLVVHVIRDDNDNYRLTKGRVLPSDATLGELVTALKETLQRLTTQLGDEETAGDAK